MRAGTAAEIPPGGRRIVRLRGRTYEIRRHAGGHLSALELSCRHQGADLSAGTIVGSVVTCPRHGWRYDLGSGACLTEPDSPLRRANLREEAGELWLEAPSALEGGI
jgi:3-phenylpropionate/trans-cinnamate dioxygenase ferredoxin subunit